MCNSFGFIFQYPNIYLLAAFYDKIINFKESVYQVTNRFNSLLKTS